MVRVVHIMGDARVVYSKRVESIRGDLSISQSDLQWRATFVRLEDEHLDEGGWCVVAAKPFAKKKGFQGSSLPRCHGCYYYVWL